MAMGDLVMTDTKDKAPLGDGWDGDEANNCKPKALRAWEILKCYNNGDRFIHGPETAPNEFVKVIEHSSYLSLQAENERLRNECAGHLSVRKKYADDLAEQAKEIAQHIHKVQLEIGKRTILDMQLQAERARGAKLLSVMQKIADPRLRDHREPDKYTEVGCMIHMAEEAIKDYEKAGE
jgi:hypothetical protein